MKTPLSLAFAAVSLCLLLSERATSQSTTDLLAEKRITIQAREKSLAWLFSVLINKYDIPIGFENSTLDDENSDFVFDPNTTYLEKGKGLFGESYPVEKKFFRMDFKDVPLRTVLDEISRQLENYRWDITDGVVNFTPIRSRNVIYQGLLDLKISKFELKPDRIESIRVSVLNLPEINEYMKSTSSIIAWPHPHRMFAQRRLTSELKLGDVTLRELLNKVAKIKRGGWLLRRDYGGRVNFERGSIVLEF